MVLLANVCALTLAVVIESRKRMKGFFRTVFYMPNMISMVIGGYMWMFIFTRVLYYMSDNWGFTFLDHSWIGDPNYAFIAIIIVSAWGAIGYLMIIYMAALQGVSPQLKEAACLDGCNIYGIFWNVILPLMRPALATLSIFIFLQAWNELMYAVIFISESKYRTITVGIQELSGSFTTDWGPIGAALVVATFPVLLIYAFFSQRIQGSLVAGAVKG
jgi:raffinose/stachyose/melibiose transport system permease protein